MCVEPCDLILHSVQAETKDDCGKYCRVQSYASIHVKQALCVYSHPPSLMHTCCLSIFSVISNICCVMTLSLEQMYTYRKTGHCYISSFWKHYIMLTILIIIMSFCVLMCHNYPGGLNAKPAVH